MPVGSGGGGGGAPLALALLGLLAACAHLPGAAGRNATVAPEKAGTCPPAEEAAAGGNCTEECQSDAGCERGQKCCPAGCGTSCRIPDDKPGSCPGDTNGISGLGFCRADCIRDSDCLADKKCCLNGCGKMACAAPVP